MKLLIRAAQESNTTGGHAWQRALPVGSERITEHRPEPGERGVLRASGTFPVDPNRRNEPEIHHRNFPVLGEPFPGMSALAKQPGDNRMITG